MQHLETNRPALRRIPVAGQRVVLAGVDALCEKAANGSLTFLSEDKEENVNRYTSPVGNIYWVGQSESSKKDMYDYIDDSKIRTEHLEHGTTAYHQANRTIKGRKK